MHDQAELAVLKYASVTTLEQLMIFTNFLIGCELDCSCLTHSLPYSYIEGTMMPTEVILTFSCACC